ncbi:hypothetical protein SISNIDRAFT_489610 [Sistotremastrum niveocremeum HHB9708]|uniref:DUF6535 domain-containing protein n=1 Tax=Sistotremastrum niveocremeum HHB9708 TaxID=1314777 RepID=A0A164PQT2_9AGAM|nr:hypothetical protein SISNIDRAFT_489610 [Sistotremastrum niveocremeum HHB9708]
MPPLHSAAEYFPLSDETRDREFRNPVPAFTSTPALDVHDTPLFHQLIGIIQEQNVTAKEQREILKGVKRVMERLEETLSVRSMARGNNRDHVETSSEDTDDDRDSLRSWEYNGSTRYAPRNQMGAAGQQKSAVVDSVKDTLVSIKDTLLEHGKKFDILTRDAIKDDQPYEQKAIDDESTCTALFEMAMSKTKEEVDRWIQRMDNSLVFIALFSAVLTAFVVPATQNLFPTTNNTQTDPTSAPPLPDISAQDVCILYYLALILAILDAVLSVLGRQWMSKLRSIPEGSTYKARLLRHLERERLAKRWLRYLVEGLHILLLWSIGLFMTGLLYQIFNLSGSFDQNAPRIKAAWAVGVILSLVIVVVMLGATIHALVYAASPFGGTFSKLLLGLMKMMSAMFESCVRWSNRSCITPWLRKRINCLPSERLLLMLGWGILFPLWCASLLIDQRRAKMEVDDKSIMILVYFELIAEASDPQLIERAIASFSYKEWFEDGKGDVAQLEKTYNRLTATDTSVRVRETIRARAMQFTPFGFGNNLGMVGDGMAKDLVQNFHHFQAYPRDFRDEILLALGKDANADLRPLAALPFEECIARVLCSYNHKGKLGDRTSIFDFAQRHCHDLLREGKEDDVTWILSHVDRLDLIKSFIQNPHAITYSLVKFIVKDGRHELLREINEFVKEVDQSRLGPQSLSQVFCILAYPPPTDIDLSPLIVYISRHPHYKTWSTTSSTIIGYLTSLGVSRISESAAVRRFLQRCVDTEVRDEDGHRCFNSDGTRAHARDLLAELDRLSSPATGAIASTSKQPASASRSASHTSPPNDASQPDRPLISPAHSLSPAPEDINADPATFANSDSDIPMLTLTPPPHMIASSESESDPPFPSDSRAVFAQSPALENARK